MSSETHFSIHVKGCAAAAYRINESRNCVMDLTSVLLEAQDNVRQIHMLNHVLGIRSAVPAPPAKPAPVSPRPRFPMVAAEKRTAASTTGGSAAAAGEMVKMDSIERSPLPMDGDLDLVVAPISLSTSRSSRTFTPVSTMQRLAHAVRDDLPMDAVAANALNFVAAWRREDQKCAAQEDLIHDCLSTRHIIEKGEEEGRRRLQGLLLAVTEQLSRFVVQADYDKFVIFCMENEPVWRHAARQMQKENDARLNSTENIYARFLFEDDVAEKKTRMYQEAADFVVSLCLVEREQRSIARMKAMARRRRQSASQVVTPATSPPESNARPRAGAAASAPPVTTAAAAPPKGASGRHRETGPATPGVAPLTAVEVDNYREGWRAVMGHLTNGERGRTSHATEATTAATNATTAAAASKGGDDKHKAKAAAAVHDAPRHGGKEAAAKTKGFVFPAPKEERKPETARSSRDESDKSTSLPPVIRRDRTVLSPSPPSPKSKEEPRGHRHSSREKAAQSGGHTTEEAAGRKSKAEAKAKEAKAKEAKVKEAKVKEERPVAVNAAPPRRADEPREERHHHHHREAKARS